MDKTKLDAVFAYFSDNNIELPTEVHNALEDVFMENDDVEEVECYHPSDLDSFQQDVSPRNAVDIYLNGESSGSTTNIWTYYGDITYTLDEEILLRDDNNQILEEISVVKPDDNFPYSLVSNPADFNVILIENVTWSGRKENAEYNRKLRLLIYCPVDIETEEEKGENDGWK